MPRSVSLAKYWLPVLVMMIIIYSASTDIMSYSRTSRYIGPVLRWFIPDIEEATVRQVQFVVRKSAHVLEYAILVILLWRAIRQSQRPQASSWSWPAAGLAALIAVAYAATDEFHQSFVPSRDGRVEDVMWDAGGVWLGIALLWGWHRWKRPRLAE